MGSMRGGCSVTYHGPEHPFVLPPNQNHLLVLLLLVFEAVVYRRQEYYRKQHQLVAPVTETIFEDISREHLDHGLGSCAKYFLNYFYYKFGLEVGRGCRGGGNPTARGTLGLSLCILPPSPFPILDLLPDDGECDRATDELHGYPARLLAGRHPDAAPAGGHRPPLAQVLPLPRRLPPLPVLAVRGHAARPLRG